MGWLKRWMADIVGVFYPRVCHVCGCSLVEGEEVLCLQCLDEMPRTRLHNQSFSVLHQRLVGKVPIERAASYFYYYKDGDYARLIQKAKYNDLPSIARYLAAQYAREISPDGFFDGIDLIIPVPLHVSKLRQRGYNQSHEIARGLSSVTGIPIGSNLVAERGHSSQTRLNAFQRWLNARDIYRAVRPAELDGRHVLVVDDVLTTGATLLSCCEALHATSPTATISVLTLSAAKSN